MTRRQLPSRHARPGLKALNAALAIAVMTLPAAAQNESALRDPMVPPPSIMKPAHTGAAGVATEPPPPPRQLMTIDGRRYVVDGRRRLGVGDALGSARIERITESAVWVRDGNTVTPLPFHGGVVKRNVLDPSAPESAASSGRTSAVTGARPFQSSTRGASP